MTLGKLRKRICFYINQSIISRKMDENGDKVTAEIVDSEAIQSTSSSAAIINTGVDQREDEIPQEQEEEGDEIPLPSNIMAEDETTTLQTSEANGIDTDRSSLNTGRMIKDRFGFIITESDISHQRLSLTAKELQLRKNKESERAGKWIFMMRKWTVFDHSSKLKSRVRKGIPDALRSFAWKQLAENDKIRTKYPVPTLDIDTSALSASVKDEIDRDINRTFPKHDQFVESNSSGQVSLRNVLQWYATVDPAVGYCQGMGFLVGMLLTYLVDEEAFYCFYAAMQLPRYNLRELFHPSMKGSRQLIYTFGQLMKLHMGRLFRHMSEQGVYPSMYVTGWIMTLFSRDFSFDLCTRVWEIFLSEGIKIVYRVCLALLKNIESQLLAMPFEEILTTIRNIPATVDAPHIIELGCSISVRRKELAAISVKFNKMLDSGNNDEIY